jgi:hypothetical protein
MSATGVRRPPWQNPRRLRQVATGAAVLLLLYLVLVFIAFLGGPRIGASFLPLPGGGPDPASPVAGLEPGQPTQNIPAIPRGTTSSPTPGATPTGITATASPLPQATTPGVTTTGRPGDPATPCPTTTPTDQSTPQIVDTYDPTIPTATQTPPTRTTPSAPPTVTPSGPPPTSSTPTTPPTTPEPPDQPSLGGLLGTLLNKLGL